MRLPITRLLLLCAPALTHELASDVAVTGSFAFMLGALKTVVVEYFVQPREDDISSVARAALERHYGAAPPDPWVRQLAASLGAARDLSLIHI